MSVDSDIFLNTPPDFRVSDVEVRLIRPDERRRWDETMDRHHYLGFKRFAGRGLRYVFEWRGAWLGLGGWQSGAFKCKPRDQWIGWNGKKGKTGKKAQFSRLHLIGNNTRFLILGKPGVFPNLATFALAAMARRLSGDWQRAFGHGLLLAETFTDPAKFDGHIYAAAAWDAVGRTKGCARSNGRHTDKHNNIKVIHVRPLRRDARRILTAEKLPGQFEANPMGVGADLSETGLRSLYGELQRLPDCRRAQGRKHSVATVFTIVVAARLAGIHAGNGAAEFAAALTQKQLESIGAWRCPKTGRFAPPSKSCIYRVMQETDSAEAERVLKRLCTRRLKIGAAIAADGKRINGANRRGCGHFETATLVGHGTGLPVASLGYHDENGETAAIGSLLEETPAAGCVITVDALHTVKNTARSIVETHRADFLMTVKKNAPETFETLSTIDWEADGVRSFQEECDKAHGRIERRGIKVMTPLPGLTNYPHIAQIFRVAREREEIKSGRKSVETAYGITSVPEERGSPEQLPAWNRGHWAIENHNHRNRDSAFDEDACLARKGHAPLNSAACNNIALALILRRSSKVAETRRHFSLHRSEAVKAVLSPF